MRMAPGVPWKVTGCLPAVVLCDRGRSVLMVNMVPLPASTVAWVASPAGFCGSFEGAGWPPAEPAPHSCLSPSAWEARYPGTWLELREAWPLLSKGTERKAWWFW